LLEEDPIEAGRIAAETRPPQQRTRQIEVSHVAQAEAERWRARTGREGRRRCHRFGRLDPGVSGWWRRELKERYGRPAFAIALEPRSASGPVGPSIAGVDLGRAVRQAGA